MLRFSERIKERLKNLAKDPIPKDTKCIGRDEGEKNVLL